LHDLRATIDALTARLGLAVRRRLATARGRVDAGAHRLAIQRPDARVVAARASIAALGHRLDLAVRRALVVASERVARAAAGLDDLSPLAVLGRGYSLVRTFPGGAIVRSAAMLAPGDELYIRFAEGAARARVIGEEDRRRTRRATPADASGGS